MFNAKFLPAYLLTFVNALGFSIMIPVLPFIVEQYGAPKYVYGLLLSLYSIFQYFGSPYLGRLSDSIGRKPILLITQAGTLLSWIIFGITYFTPSNIFFIYALPIWIIAFARIIDGVTGGNVSVTNAYVSDIATPNEKSTIYGLLGGIVGFGIIVGPGIGGLSSSSSIGYLGTVIVASIISVATLFAIFFFLKESMRGAKQKSAYKRTIWEHLLFFVKIKKLKTKPIIKQILYLRIFVAVSMSCYMGSIVLYIKDLFEFNKQELGFFMLFVGVFISINQAFVYRIIVKKIKELNTLVLGLILITIGFVVITLTNNFWIYVLLYYILNLGISISFPVFNTIISKNAEQKIQGELMGISESISSLSNAIFPVIAAYLYSVLHANFFLYLTIIPLIGFFISIKIVKNQKT